MSELLDKSTEKEWEAMRKGKDWQEALNRELSYYLKKRLELEKEPWKYLESIRETENATAVAEIGKILAAQRIEENDFRTWVKKIINKEDYKVNSLRLFGRPNSCKTLIAGLITAPFITYRASKSNPQNDFYMSDMLSKSIILLDDLQISVQICEDMKQIIGGGEMDVNVKYSVNKQRMKRTPVIVTSNHQRWGGGLLSGINESALNARCKTYNFRNGYKPRCNITTNDMINWLLK